MAPPKGHDPPHRVRRLAFHRHDLKARAALQRRLRRPDGDEARVSSVLRGPPRRRPSLPGTAAESACTSRPWRGRRPASSREPQPCRACPPGCRRRRWPTVRATAAASGFSGRPRPGCSTQSRTGASPTAPSARQERRERESGSEHESARVCRRAEPFPPEDSAAGRPRRRSGGGARCDMPAPWRLCAQPRSSSCWRACPCSRRSSPPTWSASPSWPCRASLSPARSVFREGDCERHLLRRALRARPRRARALRRAHHHARDVRPRRHLRGARDVRGRAPLGDRRGGRADRAWSRCSAPTCAG